MHDLLQSHYCEMYYLKEIYFQFYVPYQVHVAHSF